MATDVLRSIDPEREAEQARQLALRYRCEFVDLKAAKIDNDLFKSIPVDLMFRYNFVPLEASDGNLAIALADPRHLNLIDELSILLKKKLRVKVATLSQIADLLKKTEQSQRVLEEITEGFALDVVGDDENADETLSIEKLTAQVALRGIDAYHVRMEEGRAAIELEPHRFYSPDAWARIGQIRFGPAEEDGAGFAVEFWPDTKGAIPRTLGRMIADEDPVVDGDYYKHGLTINERLDGKLPATDQPPARQDEQH